MTIPTILNEKGVEHTAILLLNRDSGSRAYRRIGLRTQDKTIEIGPLRIKELAAWIDEGNGKKAALNEFYEFVRAAWMKRDQGKKRLTLHLKPWVHDNAAPLDYEIPIDKYTDADDFLYWYHGLIFTGWCKKSELRSFEISG